MKIGFLITARLKSSRLPYKLMLDIHGKKLIEHVIDRCKNVSNISEIILCTSTNPQDRPLTDIALKNNIHYFLGDEQDVLQRLSDAATFFNLDYIINITGENPFFSMYHANLLINEALNFKYDFIHIEGLPVGCAPYGLRPEALKTVCAIKKEIDTEIWGPLINQPEIFKIKKIEIAKELKLESVRITTDYIEDFNFVNAIFKKFPIDYIPSYFDVLEVIKSNPAILEINGMKEQASLEENTLNRINAFFKDNKAEIKQIKDKHYKND